MEAGEEEAVIRDVLDVMVSVVEMKEMMECLKEGQPETDKVAALHFFSQAMASSSFARPREFPHRWLTWLKLLPGLIPRLAECLLLHNSKAVQSGAMLSLKHIHKRRLFNKFVCKSNAPVNLIRLARESDCTEIQDQALVSFLGIATSYQLYKKPCGCGQDCLEFLADLVRHYGTILEPTETELYRLNTAIELMEPFLEFRISSFKPAAYVQQFPAILPVLASVFQEPRGRKKAQIHAAICLRHMLICKSSLGLVLDNGVMQMLLDTLRDVKETTDVLHPILAAASGAINDVADPETVQSFLDMGALDAFHQVLKRPNVDYHFKRVGWKTTAWELVLHSLTRLVYHGTREQLEVILSQEALMDLVLELAIGMEDMSTEPAEYHSITVYLVRYMKEKGSVGQVRRLMSKRLMLSLIHRYLKNYLTHPNYLTCTALGMVEWILELPGTMADRRLWHRLLDDAGITDDVRSISHTVFPTKPYDIRSHNFACDIFDTYFKDPLPPSPPTNLPAVIYTKNAQY